MAYPPASNNKNARANPTPNQARPGPGAQQAMPRYESVPNPANARAGGAMSPMSAPSFKSSAPSASGSGGSGSAESTSMLRRDGDDGGRGLGGVDADIGPYSHIRKGSMGRMGMRANGGRTTAAAPGAAPSNRAGSDMNSRQGYGYRTSEHSYRTAGSSSVGEKYMSAAPGVGVLGASGGALKGERDIDDYLHEPDKRNDNRCIACSPRGFLNVFVLMILVLGLLALFAGYPIISHFTRTKESTLGAFGLGGTNGTGQVPETSARLRLVDPDTPQDAMSWTSKINRADKYHLVFSDEFNTPGRTFWPGDDPHWTAVDLWYGAATGDVQWYSPEAVNTTSDGTNGWLQLTMEEHPTHNLNFRSGMVQSWNQLCFQGGYLEFSAMLPGTPNTQGWWPGLWTMGNLARPGYLGSTDGMWPYSYSSCDSGIMPNQTINGRPLTVAQSVKYGKTGLSWLSGMRTPACTCNADEHPGPNPNVGRSSPEIDVLEAQTAGGVGEASQSLQTAPFDLEYEVVQSQYDLYDTDITKLNSYTGGVYQQAVSAVSEIPAAAYEGAANPRFATFGFEYLPDWNKDGSGHIIWYIDGKATWRVNGAAMPPRPEIDIGQRLIPTEPMALIMNFGMSDGFQTIRYNTLSFPATFKIDYVRIYQLDGQDDKISCDPPDHPTSDYIKKYPEVYNNPNITTWPYDKPGNKLNGGC